MIAMAMINNPDVLIADEPTTALDVTVQAQILELIDRVKKEFDIGVILITHDLGVIAEVAQTVMVMYAGRSMERGRDGRALHPAAAPVHLGPARVDPPRRREGHASRSDRGLAAVADQRAAGLPVPSALPAPLRAVRPGAARVHAIAAAAIRRRATCPSRTSAVCGRSGGRSASGWRSDVSQTATPERARPRRPQGRRAARRGRAPDEALPDPRRPPPAHCRPRPRGRGRQLHDAKGRDPRPRRRVRLREVDDCPARSSACSTRPRARSASRGRTSRS